MCVCLIAWVDDWVVDAAEWIVQFLGGGGGDGGCCCWWLVSDVNERSKKQ